MNKIVYDLLLKLEQCDDKHNRCDYLMEHNEITYLLEHIEEKDKQLDKYKNVIDKIKEIPLKHIDNANKELQIILKNNNGLEYKNQCSHDFEIIKQNVEIIYKDILELLEEVE